MELYSTYVARTEILYGHFQEKEKEEKTQYRTLKALEWPFETAFWAYQNIISLCPPQTQSNTNG